MASSSCGVGISGSNGEVSIRIMSGREDGGDQDHSNGEERIVGQIEISDEAAEWRLSGGDASTAAVDSGDDDAANRNDRDSTYQRYYDMQQVVRWIEQILPFALLMLVVFVRQHLQGFFLTIWITAFTFKSNDILQKQTALKGERKIAVLVGFFMIFILQVIGVYWWYRNDDLLYPLMMVPPKVIPPFWHAIFIILVNDTMVRQAAMAFKLLLLVYYKNDGP